jgi:hypothetical protein
MSERKKLSDILPRTDRERLSSVWASAKPADDLKPVPAGEYRCQIVDGRLFSAKTGTIGYKLTIEVLEGEHAGRHLWWDCWLSEPALPMTKRDLQKIGVTSLEQLEGPLPEGIIVNVRVVLRKNDDETEYNRITRFDVVAIERPEPEPFAPSSNGEPAEPDDSTLDQGGFDWANGQQKDPPTPSQGRGAYSRGH